MIEITIDGKKVSVPEGSTVMEAANRLNIYIPHFCYHKKLSLAANCRMCPKPNSPGADSNVWQFLNGWTYRQTISKSPARQKILG